MKVDKEFPPKFGGNLPAYKMRGVEFFYIICLLTANGLTPGGSSTVHIYTQTIHITTQITTNWEECEPCPIFACYTLEFALQLRKKQRRGVFFEAGSWF